ncbi:unnamed protein product [Didymodactylos carnosus]|nr:unnamed protein product [Didymodactylos carnosus]CAF4271027.1 unnamed protein product [Didymodactylos carnosus]
MIPEYLNMIEACLYIWSSSWYSKQSETFDDYYSYATHKLECTAGFIDLAACFGWIMSWYRTYTRTIGCGFSFDDPDTFAYSTTTVAACIYISYNLRVLIYPDEYATNHLYYKGDILFCIGAFYYCLAALRDDGWFWFMSLAGQYGIAAGLVETQKPIKQGLPQYLVTDLCRNRRQQLKKRTEEDKNNNQPDIVVGKDENTEMVRL